MLPSRIRGDPSYATEIERRMDEIGVMTGVARKVEEA